MKAFFVFILFLSVGQTLAQSYSISINEENVAATLEMTTSVEAIQTNLTNVELDLRMELLNLQAPADWDVFLCTPSFCAAPGEWDVLYGLDQMQAAQIKVSFSPGSTHGSATATWVVSDVNDSLSTDTFSISASTLVGVEDFPTTDNLIISKNIDRLLIQARGVQLAQLFDLTGSIFKSVRLKNDRATFVTAGLPTGIYILQLSGENTLITRKINL